MAHAFWNSWRSASHSFSVNSLPTSLCRSQSVNFAGPFSLARGLGLFMALLGAVVVREIARLLVAAWLGLKLRAVLLLPIGGLFAYANPESQENSNQGGGQFAMAFAGPLANIVTAFMLAAAFMGAAGEIKLLDPAEAKTLLSLRNAAFTRSQEY